MQPGESRWFSASYDTTSKIISAVVCFAALAVIVATRSPLAALFAGALIFLCYAWSPRGYELSSRELIVRRGIGSVRIPLDVVHDVRAAGSDDLRGSIRLWGDGGLFGYYGLFRTQKLGRCWWYITNRSNIVVMVTGGKTVLLSPDDREAFIAAVRVTAPVAQGAGAAEPPAASRVPTAIATVGITLGAAGAVFAAFAILYSPGPPRCTLTADSLTIHDRFYPVTVAASSVDVANIRVVDIATDPQWRPTARTNGFSNSHYQSGWFRNANGRAIRMYRAGGSQLVLLPAKPESAPVLLQTITRSSLQRGYGPSGGICRPHSGNTVFRAETSPPEPASIAQSPISTRTSFNKGER